MVEAQRIEILAPHWLRLVRGNRVVAQALRRQPLGIWTVMCAEGYGPAWEPVRERADAVAALMSAADLPTPAQEDA